MKKKIFRNWGLKLISLLIAFALWVIVVKIDDPEDTRSFSNITVNLINTELLEQENKAYEVLDNTDTVRVTVKAPTSVIDQLRATDIVAEADMSKLTEINTIAISYSIQNVDVDVKSITGNHDVVKLSVEEKKSKWIKVVSNVIGEVADGYIISNITADQTMMEISGPKSAVDKVSYIAVELDVTGASRDVSANVEALLYDVDGKLLDLPSVSKTNDYVHMSVEVLATKEVPVEVSTMGEPAEGYLATGEVKCDTDTIMIAGKTATLVNISRVTIPAEYLDITGRTTSLVKTANIKDYLPANVKLADSNFNGRVTTTVFIEPIKDRLLIVGEEDIQIQNIPEGYEVNFVDDMIPYRVVIYGLEAAVKGVAKEQMSVTLDLKAWMEANKMEEIEEGTYEVPAKVVIDGDVEYSEELLIGLIIAEIVDEEEEEQ